jgi:thiol-disulfide isomerase/thioredoxin
MSDGNPLSPARRSAAASVRVISLVAALVAELAVGCNSKEPSMSSATVPVADTPAASKSDAPAAHAAGSGAPGAAEDSSHSPVSVEPASPEEFQKYVAAQRGKVVFVDFWATYCLPCREKFPRTLALAKKYADQGLIAISMSMDSPDASYQKKIREFLIQQNSQIKNFANRLEDTDAAFTALGIDGGALPHYKIYGRNGKLMKKFGGDPDHPFDEADIERAVVAALQEQH